MFGCVLGYLFDILLICLEYVLVMFRIFIGYVLDMFWIFSDGWMGRPAYLDLMWLEKFRWDCTLVA